MPMSAENRFRKRPLVVEAQQFFSREKPLPFNERGVVKYGCDCGPNGACSVCERFWIDTLEGRVALKDGDWIIRGVNGEFYSCKPDIFAKSYEPAGESAALPAPGEQQKE